MVKYFGFYHVEKNWVLRKYKARKETSEKDFYTIDQPLIWISWFLVRYSNERYIFSYLSTSSSSFRSHFTHLSYKLIC